MYLIPRGEDRPLTGWHMLAIVCLFFGTIIAVNLVLAFEATGTFPGLVVENSYVASQHYDELLAAAEKQEKEGWQPSLSADAGVLRFTLSDRSGNPVSGLGVRAHVGRPSTTREDRFVDFVARAGGAYEASDTLPPGLWEVDLEARDAGGALAYRNTREVYVKSGSAGQ